MPKSRDRPVAPALRNRRATREIRPATVWIETELWRALRHYAVEHDTSLSALIGEVVSKHLAPLVAEKRRTK